MPEALTVDPEIDVFDAASDPSTQIVEGVAIPTHVVEAIARAAVNAYRHAEAERKRAEARAYYRVNRARILKAQAEARKAKRVDP